MTTTILTETYKTTNYSELLKHNLQPDNRVGANADLVMSMKLTDGNRFSPIMISEKTGAIIDGHRTLEACKRAGVPVYYIKVDVEDEALFMALINSTGRQWSTANFINHFGVHNADYRILEDFLRQQGATAQLLNLFVDGITYETLRQGTDISHINYEKLEEIRRAVIFISGKFDVRTTNSMRALKRVMKEFNGNFNVTLLIEKIELAHERGDYQGLGFITTDTKLTDLLLKTYRARF